MSIRNIFVSLCRARIYTHDGVGPSLNVLQLVSELKSVKRALFRRRRRVALFPSPGSVLSIIRTPFFTQKVYFGSCATYCLLLHSVLFHLSLQWEVARPAAIYLIKIERMMEWMTEVRWWCFGGNIFNGAI